METHEFNYFYFGKPGTYKSMGSAAEDVADARHEISWRREEYADYLTVKLWLAYYDDSEKYLMEASDEYVFPGEYLHYKKEIAAELICQSYSRAAGYLLAKYEHYALEVPTVRDIYERENPDRYPY